MFFKRLIASFCFLCLCSTALAERSAEVSGQVTPAGCLAVYNGGESSDQPNKQVDQKTVGEIQTTIRPIFDTTDPKQNTVLFNLANYLHVLTHKRVVTDDLLIKEDDVLNIKRVEASERILNGRRYLGEASVTLVNPCERVVDVAVDVRDVWTLKPNLNFSKSSAESEFNFGLEDSNFFGTGKTVLVNRFNDAERSGDFYQFFDPNIGAYSARMMFSYADNDDGRAFGASLEREFIDPSTEWSAGVTYFDTLEIRRLYNAGAEALRYEVSSQNASVYGGKKFDKKSEQVFRGKRVSVVNRLSAGITRTRELFLDDKGRALLNASHNVGDGSVNERTLSFLWLNYERLTDNFVKLSNVRQINRPEYFNIGFQSTLGFGYSPTSIRNIDGESSEAWTMSGSIKHGLQFEGNHIITSILNASANYGDNRFFSSQLGLDVAYYWKYVNRAQLHLRARGTRGVNLLLDKPLILGGDTGVRGYPSFYQAGDRRAVFTVEQRYFGRREWFSLFHAGAAVFFDIGRAWGNSFIKQEQTHWLKNIGAGLRISGTRTGNRAEGAHTVLHIDLVAPLDDKNDPFLDDFQWRLTTETHF